MRRSAFFWLLLVLGIILLAGGLITGLNSHRTSYASVAQDSIAHYLSGHNKGRLQMSASSTLYYVQEDQFNPIIDGIKTLKDKDTISFSYEPGNTTYIDVTSTLGTHLVGNAYNVVQITLYNEDGTKTTFQTKEYAQYSNGREVSYWTYGIALMAVGLLFFIGSFFLPKRKIAGFNITMPNPVNAPIGNQSYPYPPAGAPFSPTQPAQYPPTQYPSTQPAQYPPPPAYYGNQQAPVPPYEMGQYPPAQQATNPPGSQQDNHPGAHNPYA